MSILHLLRKKKYPADMRALLDFIDARFDQLKLKMEIIMDELLKNIATAEAEIKDRKAEHASMKAALDLANAEIATLKAAPAVLPAGAMSAEQVSAAVTASAALVVAAAPEAIHGAMGATPAAP